MESLFAGHVYEQKKRLRRVVLITHESSLKWIIKRIEKTKTWSCSHKKERSFTSMPDLRFLFDYVSCSFQRFRRTVMKRTN